MNKKHLCKIMSGIFLAGLISPTTVFAGRHGENGPPPQGGKSSARQNTATNQQTGSQRTGSFLDRLLNQCVNSLPAFTQSLDMSSDRDTSNSAANPHQQGQSESLQIDLSTYLNPLPPPAFVPEPAVLRDYPMANQQNQAGATREDFCTPSNMLPTAPVYPFAPPPPTLDYPIITQHNQSESSYIDSSTPFNILPPAPGNAFVPANAARQDYSIPDQQNESLDEDLGTSSSVLPPPLRDTLITAAPAPEAKKSKRADYGTGAEARIIQDELGNFDVCSSQAYKTLVANFGKSLRLSELKGIINSLRFYLGTKGRGEDLPKLSRNENRSFPLLVKYVQTRYQILAPLLPNVSLCDSKFQKIPLDL